MVGSWKWDRSVVTKLRYYQSTPRNITKERRSQIRVLFTDFLIIKSFVYNPSNLLPVFRHISCTLRSRMSWIPLCLNVANVFLYFSVCLNLHTSANNHSIPFLYTLSTSLSVGSRGSNRITYITSEKLWDSVTTMFCSSVPSNLSVYLFLQISPLFNLSPETKTALITETSL